MALPPNLLFFQKHWVKALGWFEVGVYFRRVPKLPHNLGVDFILWVFFVEILFFFFLDHIPLLDLKVIMDVSRILLSYLTNRWQIIWWVFVKVKQRADGLMHNSLEPNSAQPDHVTSPNPVLGELCLQGEIKYTSICYLRVDEQKNLSRSDGNCSSDRRPCLISRNCHCSWGKLLLQEMFGGDLLCWGGKGAGTGSAWRLWRKSIKKVINALASVEMVQGLHLLDHPRISSTKPPAV